MRPEELSYSERCDWLRLARTPRIGPVGFAKLLARFGSAEAAIDALPGLARTRGSSRPNIPPRSAAEAELDAIDRAGVRLLARCEVDYPHTLACIPAPPPLILVKGRLELAAQPCCAMVGARNASAAGLRFCRELAHGLGSAGVVIVSGLARGIDGAAHAGALETGTIAVLAGGLDYIYPPEHYELHHAIARQGLLVSEVPLGTLPTARDFPRRNRLISGLSLGVLVVEAALKSGSLITARFAAEQGRDVMAVPGSPLDPRARGGNQLLRDGAHLIESVEDVLAILENTPAIQPEAPRPGLAGSGLKDEADAFDFDALEPDASEFEQAEFEQVEPTPPAATADRVKALLSPTPISADELARQAAIPVGQIRAILLELEMEGKIDVLPGGLLQMSNSS
ncbi:DNA-processing protein DprA [uncultured Maricaulis sp.]|uniref:DNA-processing protein DprA n=1 Tax=uncultured Maricaulis sp. TaxID=174710 RepID=UPI0030DBA7AE